MTVVIDGTTGIDKVQDGVIVTADIGDLQVTTAKLADGACTQAKRTYAAGEVIQTKYYEDTGSSTTSSSFVNLSGSAKNFTPKSTNSTIFVRVTMPAAYISAGGAGTNSTGLAQIYDGATQVGISSSIGVVSGAGTNMHTQAPLVCTYTITNNTSLTTRNFTIQGRCPTGYGTLGTGPQVYEITEVQN